MLWEEDFTFILQLCRIANKYQILYTEQNSTECACKDGVTDGNKVWYLKEKQKKDREIRYHEERKTQLQEKIALFERLEKEQAGWIKNILSYRDTALEEKLTAQMASLFVDKIFLYDGKRVEVVLNFKDEYESLYSHMEQVWETEEGRVLDGRNNSCFIYETFEGR